MVGNLCKCPQKSHNPCARSTCIIVNKLVGYPVAFVKSKKKTKYISKIKNKLTMSKLPVVRGANSGRERGEIYSTWFWTGWHGHIRWACGRGRRLELLVRQMTSQTLNRIVQPTAHSKVRNQLSVVRSSQSGLVQFLLCPAQNASDALTLSVWSVSQLWSGSKINFKAIYQNQNPNPHSNPNPNSTQQKGNILSHKTQPQLNIIADQGG